jgi:hypothetical protein
LQGGGDIAMHERSRKRIEHLPGKIACRRITDFLEKRRVDHSDIDQIVLDDGRGWQSQVLGLLGTAEQSHPEIEQEAQPRLALLRGGATHRPEALLSEKRDRWRVNAFGRLGAEFRS